jgi:hypothetical protein
MHENKGGVTFSDIQSCVANLEPELAKSGIALVGWLRDENGIRGFEIGGITFEMPGQGRAYVAGSGAETFERTIRAVCQEPNVVSGNPNPIEFSVSHALSMTGVLLSSESTSGEPLLNLFGGGYEIASLVKGKFRKIGDITYVLWRVSSDDVSGTSLAPYYVAKQDYRNDALLVYRALPVADKNAIKMEESVFVIKPFGTPMDMSNLSPDLPSLNSRFTCHIFFNEATGDVRSRLDYSAIAAPNSIRFDENQQQVIVSINHEFLERIVDQFK